MIPICQYCWILLEWVEIINCTYSWHLLLLSAVQAVLEAAKEAQCHLMQMVAAEGLAHAHAISIISI